MGFERRDGALAVSDRELRVVEGGDGDGERPLLNHIALLVESAEEVQRDAEERGVEIDDVKDAPNTLAVFLRGPSGVRIEYVEHKPGFALV
jgi:catechol 2,3-dioxygenase-like lactoylglutathione lyase family enzyme